jgi:hypothetical protein
MLFRMPDSLDGVFSLGRRTAPARPRLQPLRAADDAALEAVFLRAVGPMTQASAEVRALEQSARDEFLRALRRLYAIARARFPGPDAPLVREDDVLRVVASFRRLSLMWGVLPEEVADYCEAQAANDTDVRVHRADPLQIRHVLTFHRPGEWASARGPQGLAALRNACVAQDAGAMRAWFDAALARKAELPGDLTQALRAMIVQLWSAGSGDVETLAYETAVLDVSLFDAMGWENARAHCAWLHRIGGARRPVFGSYLTKDEAKDARALHEALGDRSQVAYFHMFVDCFDARVLRDLERAVYSSSKYAGAIVQPDEEIVAALTADWSARETLHSRASAPAA